MCFNDDTGERVEDTQCDNSSTDGRSSGIYAWYFYSRGASVNQGNVFLAMKDAVPGPGAG
ncbi:hypothetical protein SAMN04487914_13413 [Arthrobacter sp. ok909]|nr:hypothetical protein SAMN04487914_13413 [Arthrobacter sp. ok909]